MSNDSKRRCGNCGAPATALVVELGEEADYGFACDTCKRHPAVRRWRPLDMPNAEVTDAGTA